MSNGNDGTKKRAAWNVLGSLGAAAMSLLGAYFLIEVLKPLVAGDRGALGYVAVAVIVVVLYVALFFALRWITPRWVDSGEKRFPG